MFMIIQLNCMAPSSSSLHMNFLVRALGSIYEKRNVIKINKSNDE
mgnify:CR=1 FL=1